MSIELITVLMVGSLLLLLLLGVPIAFALGFVAVGFAWAFFGWNAIQLIASRIYGFVNVYVLLVGADVPADGGDHGPLGRSARSVRRHERVGGRPARRRRR